MTCCYKQWSRIFPMTCYYKNAIGYFWWPAVTMIYGISDDLLLQWYRVFPMTCCYNDLGYFRWPAVTNNYLGYFRSPAVTCLPSYGIISKFWMFRNLSTAQIMQMPSMKCLLCLSNTVRRRNCFTLRCRGKAHPSEPALIKIILVLRAQIN